MIDHGSGLTHALTGVASLWCVLAVAFGTPAVASAEQARTDWLSLHGVRQQSWQARNACGPNCLYVYLRSHGVRVAHDEVLGRVPVGDAGCTLLALKQTAAELGLPSRAVQSRPEELRRFTLPVIAHLGEGRSDHYVLLTSVGGGKAGVIDGTTGGYQDWDLTDFEKRWSGHLLVPDERFPWWVVPTAGVVVWLAVVLPGRFARRGVAVAALVVLAAAPVQANQRDAAPPGDVAQFANSLSLWFKQYRELDGLEVEYRYDQRVFEERSAEVWAWPWGEFVVALKPSELGKLSVQFTYPPPDEVKNLGGLKKKKKDDNLTVRQLTSDNRIRGDMQSTLGGAAPKPNGPGRVGVRAALLPPDYATPGHTSYNPYFRLLAIPTSANPEEHQKGSRTYPEDSYWLPDGVLNHARSYRPLPPESVNGELCAVVERPGVDKIWYRTAPTFAITRRLTYWRENGKLRQDVTYSDFREVRTGLAFPATVVIDRYSSPFDEGESRAKLSHCLACRQVFRVSRFSASGLPDERFRLKIPVGAEVHDHVSDGKRAEPTVFVNQPDQDPFELALQRVERDSSARKRSLALAVGLSALAVGALAWAWSRGRARRAGRLRA